LRTRALFASGTIVAFAFALVILVGVFVVVLYKTNESGLPPVGASFRLLESAPANATVHELDYRAVHARDSFLEDHLDTTLQLGTSREAERLRVEQMRATLRDLTGDPSTALVVKWKGAVVQVAFSGFIQ